MTAYNEPSPRQSMPAVVSQGPNAATPPILGLLGKHGIENHLLKAAIEALATLLGARYGAIGIFDNAGTFKQFVYTGITAAEARHIGPAPGPEGRGLLGIKVSIDHVLCIDDLSADPRSVGFPPHHPMMKTLLIAPISWRGQIYGHIYLSEKADGHPFSHVDELITKRSANALAPGLAYQRSREQQRGMQVSLHEVAEALSIPSSDDFLENLVLTLSRTLDVDYVFIGEFCPGTTDMLRTLAFCAHGTLTDNIDYPLSPPDTLCGGECKMVCHIAGDAMKRFPRDSLIQRYHVNAFIGHPIATAGGQVLGLIAVMHKSPITERNRVQSILLVASNRTRIELERRRHTQLLHDALDNTVDGIARIDGDGRYIFANKACATILGYAPTRLLKKRWPITVHPDDKDAAMAGFQHARSAGKAELNIRMRRKNGVICHYHVVMVRDYDSQTNSLCYHLFMQDDTERQRYKSQTRSLSHVVEQTADAVVITDRYGIIQYVNPAHEDTTGYTKKECLGKNASMIKSGIHDSVFYTRMWKAILRGDVFRARITNRKKDGTLYYEEKTITPLRNDTGNITHFVSTGKDVTASVAVEEALRVSVKHLEEAQRIAHIGHWERDLHTNEMHWSAEVYRIFGLSSEEFTPNRAQFLNRVHRDDHYLVETADHRAATEATPSSIDCRIITLAGTERIVHYSATANYDDAGTAVQLHGTVQDVTEHRRNAEQLNHLAYYDPLTGLPNRTLLYDRLRVAIVETQRRGRILALMFLDLDHFKIVNDTLGHEAGDNLLKMTGERLVACMRASDTVSRLGGDEFTILLTDIACEGDVAYIAQKILDCFSAPFNIAGRELFVSTSIGITLSPLDDDNVENLLRNADAAMYHAKALGRHMYRFYTKDLNHSTNKRLAMETALRHAVTRDEFVLYYQPQVSLDTGRIIGVEALIRWQDPDSGLVPPNEFIPIIEENGLIIPISEWVLHAACTQAKVWDTAGFATLQVAVNLSGRQFQHYDLPALVAKVLNETGINPGRLDMELTESIMIHNTDVTLATMEQVRGLGVVFSLDDFGTGYSSLSYLKRFPISTLKIDQSFVGGIASDPNDATIVRTIITMSHSLGIRVIAEGVETAEQLDFLRTYECDAIQGYYFSKPLTADAMTDMLQAGRCLA